MMEWNGEVGFGDIYRQRREKDKDLNSCEKVGREEERRRRGAFLFILFKIISQ